MKHSLILALLSSLVLLTAVAQSVYKEHFESLIRTIVHDFPNRLDGDRTRTLRSWLETQLQGRQQDYYLESDISPWDRTDRLKRVVNSINSDDNARHLPELENQLYEAERQLLSYLVRYLNGMREPGLSMAFANYKALESVYHFFCLRQRLTGLRRPPKLF